MKRRLEEKEWAAKEAVRRADQDRLWERQDKKDAEKRTYEEQKTAESKARTEGEKAQSKDVERKAVSFLSRMKQSPDEAKYVYKRAQELGIDPGDAFALWGNESGYSLDTALPGDQTRHGRAIGPWQVMPFHRKSGFPATEADMQDADRTAGKTLFQAQTDYALKYFKEVGTRGYYGTGKPIPGHPNTDQYEAHHNDVANEIRKYFVKTDDPFGLNAEQQAKAAPLESPYAPPKADRPAYDWYRDMQKSERDFHQGQYTDYLAKLPDSVRAEVEKLPKEAVMQQIDLHKGVDNLLKAQTRPKDPAEIKAKFEAKPPQEQISAMSGYYQARQQLTAEEQSWFDRADQSMVIDRIEQKGVDTFVETFRKAHGRTQERMGGLKSEPEAPLEEGASAPLTITISHSQPEAASFDAEIKALSTAKSAEYEAWYLEMKNAAENGTAGWKALSDSEIKRAALEVTKRGRDRNLGLPRTVK
jgi:hypothetical protein